MGLFEALDDLYQRAYNYGELSRLLVEAAAFFGALILIFYLIKFVVSIINGELPLLTLPLDDLGLIDNLINCLLPLKIDPPKQTFAV